MSGALCPGLARQLRHPRQMVIVVLGGEEGHVDYSHGLMQAGVEGGQADQVFVPGVETGDEALALVAEGRQDLGERPLVVSRFPGPGIRGVGGAEPLGAGQEVVQASVVELVQIEQVADVLLDRPGVAGPAGQQGGGEAADLVLDPGRRPPQALHDEGEVLLGEVEGEVAVGPAGLHAWIVGH